MDFHNFSCTTSQENAKVTGVKKICDTLVMLLPYRVEVSDTKVTHFTPILALCTCLHVHRSHLQKPVSMKQTAESQRLKIYVHNVHHSREHMWPIDRLSFKVISGTINSFIVCIPKIQHITYEVSHNGRTHIWRIMSNYFHCRIGPEGLHDAERDLLGLG